MKMFEEFKKFAMRGNVLDLAVAVIIGGAFGKIISSLVNDILMPPVGLLLGNRDFSNMRVILKYPKEAIMEGDQIITPAIAEVSIKYGAFISTVLDFLIVVFSIFLVIRFYNRLKKKEELKPAAPPPPSKEEVLLSEIRDILKEKN
jgi:large conductance mechanosensitive channel